MPSQVNPPLRILHVMDKLSVDGSHIAGPARQIAYRVPHYDSARYEVKLVNLRGEDAASRLLRDAGVDVVSLGRGRLSPLTLADLLRIIRSWHPHLLHLHGYAAWSFGRVAGRLTGLPVVVQEHFVDRAMPAYQRLADWLLRGLQDRALAVSGAVGEFMTRQRYVRRPPIEVIPNGVPVEEVRAGSAHKRGELRRALGLPEGAPVVGTVGRLAEMKGHDVFLRAAARIARELPAARFVVVGDGPLAGDLHRLAGELGIAGRVCFAGYREDVPAWLALFDVDVIASVHGEGFCSVGLEAFAAAVPLVITDLPAFRSTYVAGENVLMVPPGDAEALAGAVLRVLREPDLARRLVEAGSRSLAPFDTPAVAARYTRLYEEVLRGRAAA